jgi:hypothetical protein
METTWRFGASEAVAHDTVDFAAPERSCGLPEGVPVTQEDNDGVPTSDRWGHQRKARLRPGFSSARGLLLSPARDCSPGCPSCDRIP